MALFTAASHSGVAHLAAESVLPPQSDTVNDGPATDSRRGAVEVDEVADAPPCAKDGLRDRRDASIVPHDNRKAERGAEHFA